MINLKLEIKIAYRIDSVTEGRVQLDELVESLNCIHLRCSAKEHVFLDDFPRLKQFIRALSSVDDRKVGLHLLSHLEIYRVRPRI